MSHQSHHINEQIKAKEVLLINEKGEKIGLISIQDALQRAEEAALDLVAVDSNSEPVVCKIMDYGKYKYTQKKKPAKKTAQPIKVKEIRLRPKIEQNDLQVKIRHARELIESNCKVKFSMMFRGRESMYVESGFKIMEQIYADLQDVAKYDNPIKKEGSNILMVLAKI